MDSRWIRVRISADLVAGWLVLLVGGGALLLALDWEAGTPDAMRSGFFPRLIGVGLCGLGAAIAVRALVAGAPPLTVWNWRPLLFVPLSVLAFAALLDRGGLVLAILGLVFVAGQAGCSARIGSLAVLGSVLAVIGVGVFVWGLDLPLSVVPVWP